MLRPSVRRLELTTRHLLTPSKLFAASPPKRTFADMSENARPTGLIAKKGLELLTLATPNGVKATIYLEELKAAYGLEYTYQKIDIGTNVQKEDWYTKHGPNGRIPVLVDHDRNYSVQEGSAILEYLAKYYDPENKFHFTEENDRFDVIQWLAFLQSGVGPMQGQANHFVQFAKEKIPYAIQRYVGETERLYGVLNTRLTGRDYLAGPGKGKYSIADIGTFGWVNIAYFSGVDFSQPQFSELRRWWKSINEREAVQSGQKIPDILSINNQVQLGKLESGDAEFKKSWDDRFELVKKAKEQYNYKYSAV